MNAGIEKDELHFEVRDSVATIALNRPARRNALSYALRSRILECMGKIREQPAIKAVVLTGNGGHFCSGGDIQGMQAALTAPQGRIRLLGAHHFITEMLNCERPVIAAVDGVAYGAGMGLALTADFIVASPRARFCSAFLRMGLVPDLGLMHTLPRLVGLQRAKEIVFTGREIDAREALALGLVLEIAEDGDVLAHAQALGARFAQASGPALGMAKHGLNTSFESGLSAALATEAYAQGIAMSSPEHQDAVRRFLNKEPPLYQWQKK